jgi:hypothetical protein
MGGSVGIQLPRLRARLGAGVHFRDLGYLASEGRMSLPTRDDTPSGLLALNTNFYEFVPEDEDPATSAGTLLAHEIEAGKRYYVLITNAGGLYRYDMNDIVEVTGFTAGCPEIAFVRKGRDMTSLTGEKLHVNHCVAAMSAVRGMLPRADLVQFRIWPDAATDRYEVAVELETPAATLAEKAGLVLFLRAFDDQLRRENVEYEAKRKSSRLAAPRLHLMSPGWFEREKARVVNGGGRDIQLKWAVLVKEAESHDLLYVLETFEMTS